MTPLEWREEYDHAAAVVAIESEVPGWRFEQMTELLWFEDGEYDGDAWCMLWKANDGAFWYTSAWCDYTGWDCRSGGEALRFETEEEARLRIRM